MPESVTIRLPGAVFTFDNPTIRANSFDTVLSVWREIPDDPLARLDYEPERVFRYHIQGRSLSNVTAYRRELEKFHGDDLDWNRLLHEAIQQAEAECVAQVRSIDPFPNPERPRRGELVEGVFPLNAVSCVFGMGESAKSLGVESAMASASWGRHWLQGKGSTQTNCLWLDYESENEDDFGLRRQALAAGGWDFLPGSIRWIPARGVPVPELIDTLSREMVKFHSGALVVDSVVYACGGDPLKADVASGFYNALAALPTSSKILIAHTDKAENDKYPFGSIFWHNGLHGRSWYVKTSKDETSVSQAWYLRKNSNGRRPQEFALRFDFYEDDDEERILLSTANLEELSREQGKQGHWEKIEDVLREGKADLPTIATRSGVPENTARTYLSRMLKKQKVVKVGREWGLSL